jgi:hypothetical protein
MSASDTGNPSVVVLPNLGRYRLDFTGDITDTRFFDKGDLKFELMEGSGTREPLYGDEWKLVVSLKFLRPGKILFYQGGLKVRGAHWLALVSHC